MGSFAREDIHLRIVGHHALIHAIKCQVRALRIPEHTAIDTELAAVHTLTIDDLVVTIKGYLVLLAHGIGNIDVIVLDIGC